MTRTKRISLSEVKVSVGLTVYADKAATTQSNAPINRLVEALCDASEAKEPQQANQLADVLPGFTEVVDKRERGRHG